MNLCFGFEIMIFFHFLFFFFLTKSTFFSKKPQPLAGNISFYIRQKEIANHKFTLLLFSMTVI